MKLESVSVNRFRSIESGELTNCGGFNVIIGKNNSGKSNVLSAIHAFFDCMQSGNVVTLNPPIGQEIDFYEKEIEHPIDITLTFSLSLAERDALIRDIVTEAPQMKNAADGLDPSLRLSVTVSIAPPPTGFGFVSKIALVGIVRTDAKDAGSEKLIFSVSKDAASELYDQFYSVRQRSDEVEMLSMMTRQHARRHFDEIRSDSGGLPPLRYLFPSEALAKVSKELISELETILVEEKSYEDFSSAVQTLETRIQEDAARVQEEPIRNKIGTFAGEESSIPDYVRNILHGISEMKVLYLKEQRKSMGKKEAARLLSLKTRRGGAEDLRNIQETVSALLGVQIDAFQSDSRSRRGETTAEMDVDNFLVEVNGSGIREALRIVLDIEFEHPNILLIEEPEIHLHPSLETSMMRYLKRVSPDCQVFIATHSTNFLDTGEMKNVYLVSKPDSTRIQLLDYEEAEAQIPRELGIRLSSLFMFDRLVFVEGPSDETILREWASTLRVNLSKSNVGFIHMEGARNFTHFATKATLSVLTKRQVQMWFIMDRDERDDAEIDKLKEIAGENAVVKVVEERAFWNSI
jgi:predicted ATP-dependent endonuclease of OLD family